MPLLICVACVAGASGAEIKLPPETAVFRQDYGAEIANGHCLVCHSVEYVSTQPPMPRDYWMGSVRKMQQKYGARIPEEQVDPLVDYLVKNYGSATNPAAVTTTPRMPAAAPSGADGPALATRYGCLGCHNVKLKVVGPTYREIAAKYASDSEASVKITQQVRQGGSGKWGPVIMPPFPQISDAQVKILSDWILGSK